MVSGTVIEGVAAPRRAWRPSPEERMDLAGSLPFLGVHLAALAVFFVGFSWFALAMAVLLYAVRMFGITAGYHRYLSHKSFQTSRGFQFVLAALATSSGQMGPLWWAGHHRLHHLHSDTPEDVHSPVLRTIWWSHVGWILCGKYMKTVHRMVRDLERYPELEWLNRFYLVPPAALAAGLLGLGCWLRRSAPGLGTDGPQLLVWGFFVSTVFLYHGTFSINSLCHLTGRRRYDTGDGSRNSFLLALVTLGEGWHNNHHRYPASERQGFFWWEFDPTHYALRALGWMGLVWGLKSPPQAVLDEARFYRELKSGLDPRELEDLGLPNPSREA